MNDGPILSRSVCFRAHGFKLIHGQQRYSREQRWSQNLDQHSARKTIELAGTIANTRVSGSHWSVQRDELDAPKTAPRRRSSRGASGLDAGKV